MELAFKKVRLIHWALISAVPLFAWIAEIGRAKGCADWTWRYWLVMGLAAWSTSGAFRFRSRASHRANENMSNYPNDTKAVKQWKAVQILSLAMAEGVAYWGLLVPMVFDGTFWQASLFYAAALLLLLLWTPRLPSATALS